MTCSCTTRRIPVASAREPEELRRARSALERELLSLQAYLEERRRGEEHGLEDALELVDRTTREGLESARDWSEAAETLHASAFHVRTLLDDARAFGHVAPEDAR